MRWDISESLSRMCGLFDPYSGKYYRWRVLPWGTNIAPFI
jgi:hypothetical protein